MAFTTEETIKQVLELMHRGLIIHAEEEHRDEVVRLMDKHGEALLDPEKFHLFVDFPHESMTDILIRALLHSEDVANDRELDEKCLNRLILFYKNYQLVDNHLDRLMEKTEGMTCSSDKTRFVLREYKQYLVDQELPEWTNRGKYSVPRFGQPQEWFALVDSLLSFTYGFANGFITAYQTLERQLTEEKEAFTAKRQVHFETHAHYTGRGEHPKNDVFTFTDDTFQLDIHLAPNMRDGYICTRIATGERLEYKDDKPDWVTNLMKWI